MACSQTIGRTTPTWDPPPCGLIWEAIISSGVSFSELRESDNNMDNDIRAAVYTKMQEVIYKHTETREEGLAMAESMADFVDYFLSAMEEIGVVQARARCYRFSPKKHATPVADYRNSSREQIEEMLDRYHRMAGYGRKKDAKKGEYPYEAIPYKPEQ
jgi:hypothetical protein